VTVSLDGLVEVSSWTNSLDGLVGRSHWTVSFGQSLVGLSLVRQFLVGLSLVGLSSLVGWSWTDGLVFSRWTVSLDCLVGRSR
jgi:hypothetical protein